MQFTVKVSTLVMVDYIEPQEKLSFELDTDDLEDLEDCVLSHLETRSKIDNFDYLSLDSLMITIIPSNQKTSPSVISRKEAP